MMASATKNDNEDSMLIFDEYNNDELEIIESEFENKSSLSFVNLPVDYKDIDIIEKNGFNYVCGYFLKKMLLRHKDCAVCQENLVVLSSSCPADMYLNLRNFEDAYSGLTIPSNKFVQYMRTLETQLLANMTKYMYFKNVVANLTDILIINEFPSPCENVNAFEFVQTFVRIRIYYILMFFNRQLKNKDVKNLKLQILKNM